MSELEDLSQQVQHCQRCRLYKTATHGVPGEGPADARIMFVGEAPGFHEDQQGRPFVGAAGQFLEKLLATINLSRRDVYITNVVKHRPPENRDPQPDEVLACRPYLDCQIALIKPKIIVTLGRFSMQLAFSGVSITQVHGMPKKVGEIIYFPMFHPAAALHQPKYRSLIERDFLKLPEILADFESAENGDSKPDLPKQLNLF
ncbi:MAG: uracil-DNA glycosylase family protein [Anaerolineae bacterium]